MSMLGMDTDAVRQLAAKFTSSADEIRSLMNSLNSSIHGVQWVGSDHNQFVESWDSQHMSQLRQVAEALDNAATSARNNATQQDQASSAV
jgi:uncharacterized protein YukE